MNKKYLRQEKGITLIALIITIIVMLILVSVTITIAVNGGLFNYASKAVKETENAKEEEQLLASGKIKIGDKWYDSMDDYIKGIVSGTDRFSEIKTANYEYTDKNGITVTIPKGFAYATSNGANTVAGGLVITDAVDENGVSTGNEFVWIPVTDGTLDRTAWFNNMTGSEYIAYMNTLDMTKDDDKTKLKTDLATFYATDGGYDGYPTLAEAMSDQGINTVEEYLAECVGWEYMTGDPTDMDNIKSILTGLCTLSAEYDDTLPTELVNSVNHYKGFYIGRYEAGSQTIRTNAGASTLTNVLCKKNLYPYNFVSYTNANTKTNSMYGNTYGVTSTLPYGAMWDEVLRFIKSDTINVTNSTTWGNYNNHTFEFEGKYTSNPWDTNPTWENDKTTKPEDTSWLLTTGASNKNKAKNIYDLAGNVWEWTNEAYSSYRVCRGGGFSNYGYDGPASYRGNNVPSVYDYIMGFRPALYVDLSAE